MNIENEKLSGRQFGRMIFYDFFALTTLLLPRMLAQTAGMDGFFALAGGYTLGYVFLLLVLAQMRRMGEDYHTALTACFGKTLTAVILIVYLFVALLGAAYGLRLLCGVIRQYLIRDTPVWLVLGVLVVLAIYGLGAGLECRGRMYEIIFWFVIVPLVVLLVLAAYNVEPDRWVPIAQAGGGQVVQCMYRVFAFLVGSAFFPMLVGSVRDHAEMSRAMKHSFVLCVCINLVLFLLLTGIFGVPTVAVMEEAALALTAMVKVPGGFLERQDALLCGIWFVGIFAFVENALYYFTWSMKKLVGRQAHGWYLFAAGVLVYALAALMYRYETITSQLSRSYMRIGVPVLAGVVLVFSVLQTGCGQLEIEDRAFPLALAVTPAKEADMYEFSFFFEETDTEGNSLYHKEDTVVTAAGYPQAFTLFGRAQAAQLDDSHMKVILLSEELLRDEKFLGSFYGYFMKEHHFSWNTMVYLLDKNSLAPEKLRESTSGRPGTYLRDIAQSDEQEKTSGVPTLGDLYKEWNNHEKILLLPVLAQSTPPSVDHYRLLVFGDSDRTLSVDEARLLQLLRGDLKKMQVQLPDGTIVGLEDIRLRREYVPERDVWRVTLCMEGETENRVKPSAKERQQIICECTDVLNEQMSHVEQWALIRDAHGQLVWPEYVIDLRLTE